MSSDRRAILQLLAIGRINSAEAERLLAAIRPDWEAALALAGCVVVAAASQLHSFLPVAQHLSSTLAGSLPAFQHLFTSISVSLGG